MDRRMLNLQDEEEEGTISLSDFPINSEETKSIGSQKLHNFEFFSDLTYEMSYADDIIFCGKLIVPLREHPIVSNINRESRKQRFTHHRRCESERSQTNNNNNNNSTTKGGRGHVRSSRSLDYGKYRRIPNLPLGSSSEAAKTEGTMRLKIQKPRWYVMMFGHMPEMELRDIKKRQIGICQPMFALPDRRNNIDRRTSWDLLKVLSCKDHASVSVTTSFRCTSRA